MICVPAGPDACANEYGAEIGQPVHLAALRREVDRRVERLREGALDHRGGAAGLAARGPARRRRRRPRRRDELELEPELPHAATANAMATAAAAQSGLLYFLMRPPPRGLSGENLNDRARRTWDCGANQLETRATPGQPGQPASLRGLEIDPGELGDPGDPVAQRVAVHRQAAATRPFSKSFFINSSRVRVSSG